MMDPVRIYVGTDTSQQLAVKVLEYSVKRRTKAPVEVHPMCDLPIRTPKDLRQGQRTGFSFSRFVIPELAGYKGKAIYMDADMLVLRDILDLWETPFHGKKVLVQEVLKDDESKTKGKLGAPKRRIRQCAVMLMDCSRLDWKVNSIVDKLDSGELTYETLMYDLKLLNDDEIGETLPFEWNSLETLTPSTGNIHYTDMHTQPWVSTWNSNGQVWFDEVRHMLEHGELTWESIHAEIEKGFFRPSLIRDLKLRHKFPKFLLPLLDAYNHGRDKAAGFVMHKAVYEAKRKRELLIKEQTNFHTSKQVETSL